MSSVAAWLKCCIKLCCKGTPQTLSEHIRVWLPDICGRLACISLHLKAKQPVWNKWARGQPVSATSLYCVCSAALASRSFPDASNDNIINHFQTTQTQKMWGVCGARHLIKVFAPLLSVRLRCSSSLRIFCRMETPQPRNFSKHWWFIFVALCGVS